MVETATGLVLRTRLLTETSLIVHWLTPNLGRIATVAKGARRPKSPFRGKLDLFYRADFSFTRSRTSELHNLREISLRETYPFLRQEINYLQKAAYCVRLIETATETEAPLGGIFELIQGFLRALPVESGVPHLVFAFEIKLLGELGLQPDLARAELSDGAKSLVRHLQKADWLTIPRLRLASAQQRELRRFLHGYLVFHLGKIPKGREAALDCGAAE